MERNWGTNIVNINIKKKKKSCKVGVIATFACGIGGWGISRNVLLMDGCD